MERSDTSDQFQSDVLNRLTDFYVAELAYLGDGGPDRSSFDGLAAYLDPDVVTYQGASLPYGGAWHGYVGMQQHFGAMNRAWESFEILDQTFIAQDETVIVRSRIRARSRANLTTVEFPMVQVITVKDGLITEFQQFYRDTVPIVAACNSNEI